MPALCVFGITLVFYIWLASRIPYTCDDWDWGLPIGMEQLLYASINSRYAGNLVEVIVTRSELAKTLILALCFALLPVSMLPVLRAVGVECDDAKLLIAANFILLAMPTAIWQQSYGWIAGFSNYVTCALFLVLSHVILIKPRRRSSLTAVVGAFVFGVVMQLFLENTALYCIPVSLVFLLVRTIKERRLDFVLLALFIGNLIGLKIMFSSSIYCTLMPYGYTMAGNRNFNYDVNESLSYKIIRSLKYYIKYFPSLWNKNVCLSTAILIALFASADKKRRPLVGAVNAVFALYFILTAIFGDISLSSEKLTVYLALSIGVLYFCLVAVECIVLLHCDRRRMWILLGLWISAPAAIAPLAVTDIMGGRLFLPSYVMETEFLLLLIAPLLNRQSKKSSRITLIVSLVLLAAVFVRIGAVYLDIGRVSRQRDAMFSSAEPGQTLTVPAYPHADYLWEPDPDETRVGYFRQFYGIGDDVELIFEGLRQDS